MGALVCSRYKTIQNLLPTPLAHPKHARELFRKFQSRGIQVNGVVGELHTVRRYRDLFLEMNSRLDVHMTQGIYRCEKVLLPKIAERVRFRVATPADAGPITEWIESFHREAVPHDPPVDSAALARNKLQQGMIYVVEREGILLSMAARARDIGSSCSVNLVFTPRENRKMGYGSAVTALLTQYLLDSGKKETHLYTDMSNPTSNKIYREIGYQFVCDSVHLGVS